jgi:hypothetical protein
MSAPTQPAFATTTTTSAGTPALEAPRVAGELLAGAYASIGGYMVGSWVGGLAAEPLPASDDTKEQISFATGVVGASFATAAAVSAVGSIGDQTGSYGAAVGGAAGGVVAGFLVNQILYGHARLPSQSESSRMRWVEASVEALLPSIGATLAFNSSRRFK